MSVQVAVRVRPFNQREIELNSSLIVDMEGQKTKLIHPSGDEKKDKEFTFDYSFWSHDGFEIEESGLSVKKDDKYADQRQVYETLGENILNNAWEGYNCCLFAYGQTGAGKSYSMVGYKPNIGIVPIACQEIFKRIDKNENDNITFEVYCSMVEIYNEKVQDLLVPTSKRPPGGLKIRENKVIGFYVDGLAKCPVDSYQQIEQIMDDGSKNRTIASTQMNACSSRAHTIITIEFKQIEQTEKKKTEKTSVINLVDLAGSEKVGKTGASGDRLKEASNINKSLSMLGLVISTLADQQMGKKVKVPYRDSCLTKILANALGGNSKTVMICAISPALDNYEESLSTLRYADQAKKIKNKAIINESATDKLIRELNTEIEDLRKKMEFFNKFMGQNQIDMNDPQALEKALGGRQFQEMLEVKQNYEASNTLMDDAKKTHSQRVNENKQIHFQSVDLDKPHLTNLNEDPLLTRRVQYSLSEEVTHIGKKNGDPQPQIILNAMGIKANHAIITTQEGKVFIEPIDEECSEFMFVNGENVTEKMELMNYDRIIFGTNSTFICIIPDGELRDKDLQQEKIDWEFAQEELSSNKDQKKKDEDEEQQLLIDQEVQKQLQEIEKKNQREKEEMEALRKIQEEEYERKLKELEEKQKEENQKQLALQEKKLLEQKRQEQIQNQQNEKKKKIIEQEKEKRKIQEQETIKKNKIKDSKDIHQKLHKILPRIVEVNLFAKELDRKVELTAKLNHQYYVNNKNTEENKQLKKLKIYVQVQNNETGTVYLWDINKFNNRYYIIKDLLDRYYETHQKPVLDQDEDPFWDPPEAQLIGQGFLRLQSLSYLMDSDGEIAVVGESGTQSSIKLNLIPTDEKYEINLGDESNCDADYIEDPSELLERDLHFIIYIEHAKIHAAYNNCYIEYYLRFKGDDSEEERFKTELYKEKTDNPVFNYKGKHKFTNIDANILEYINNSFIRFQIYGEQEIQQEIQLEDVEQIDPSELANQNGNYKEQYSQQNNNINNNYNQQTKQPNPSYEQKVTQQKNEQQQYVEQTDYNQKKPAVDPRKRQSDKRNPGQETNDKNKKNKNKNCNIF